MIEKPVSKKSASELVKSSGIILAPNIHRVILRPHISINESQVERVISRVLSLNEIDVRHKLKNVIDKFSHRHHNLPFLLENQFNKVRRCMPTDSVLSQDRKQLIGSFFWSEYSFESAALFNPSIIPHPDQSSLAKGSLRFIISLRATGEGHISSLSFRSGVIDENCTVTLDDSSIFASAAAMKADSLYNKSVFTRKLREMSIFNEFSNSIIGTLPEEFTLEELSGKIKQYIFNQKPLLQTDKLNVEKIQWLAQCNYEADFDSSIPLSERVLFPLSPSEQNGIEDARFTPFTDDDGSRRYYATYTAYNGRAIFPQLMETENFEHFKMTTLNGSAALDKGMALFPRRIDGRFAMISRQDNENLFIMYSDNIHFWHEAEIIMKPRYSWEFIKIGTCGAPIETEHGWLLLTHGVGAFRQYSISAVLLDRQNPAKIIGRLREPLIQCTETSRSGYVPNVVYTCGALIHQNNLVIPYAMSDQQSAISTISMPVLLEKLLKEKN
ncbi:MAG TPA: glycoside hydrolase family 130 protein [bacterium]|nr:glycoside hydrolase family 130 protein [bacterium]